MLVALDNDGVRIHASDATKEGLFANSWGGVLRKVLHSNFFGNFKIATKNNPKMPVFRHT